MYSLLAPREAIRDLIALLPTGPILAFDTETTGLDPRHDKLRLVQYLPSKEKTPRIVDVWAGTPDETTALLRLLAEFRLITHNSTFDQGWMLVRGIHPKERVYDTMNLTKLALAGEKGPSFGVFQRTNLENVARYFLGVKLDKSQQSSPWSRPHLTQDQLNYAAMDVEVLPGILDHLSQRIRSDKLEQAARLETDAAPCLAWMSAMGAPFDPELWAIPYREALIRRETSLGQIREFLTDAVITRTLRTSDGDRPDPRKGGQSRFPWGYEEGLDRLVGSPGQLLAALRLFAYPYPGTGDDYLAAWGHPLGELLRDYREMDQIRKSFGPTWGRKANKEEKFGDYPSPVRHGRVFPWWKQAHTETGRMSCAYPNLQQVPKPDKHPLGRGFRSAFRAPKGRELVVADFSQIELRIAAQISGDRAMRQAYLDGADIHTEASKWVLGVDNPTKHDRQIMKSANFGLLYGAGVETFRVYAKSNFGVTLEFEQAQDVRERWFRAFPGIRQWHRDTGNQLDRNNKRLTTRTLSGRARKHVERYTECLNTPVQGSGADMTKLALARIYAEKDNAPVQAATSYSGQGWFPVMVIHDEIVLEVPEGSGEEMARWLKGHMIAAGEALMPDVPCDAEAGYSKAWVK